MGFSVAQSPLAFQVTVFLGSSLPAHRFAQHVGERGDEPERKRALLKGESKRKRLGIPMLMGEVT
jgi:hypothetical protein